MTAYSIIDGHVANQLAVLWTLTEILSRAQAKGEEALNN